MDKRYSQFEIERLASEKRSIVNNRTKDTINLAASYMTVLFLLSEMELFEQFSFI